MDSEVSENKVSRPLRRSARHAGVKVLNIEPTPRGPLKRTKRRTVDQDAVTAVNGSKDKEKDSEDEESPCKKSRLEAQGPEDGSGDEKDMDVQESAEDSENNQDQEMDMERQDSSHDTHSPIIRQGRLRDEILYPCVVLHERCPSSNVVNKDLDSMKTKRVKPSTREPAAPTKSAIQTRPPPNKHDVSIPKIPSMADYKRTMEAKAKSTDIRSINHLAQSTYRAPEKYREPCLKYSPKQKGTVQPKKQGFMWYLWCLVLLVLLSSAALLAYRNIPVLQRVADGGGHLSRAGKPEIFANQLSLLEAQFPSQQPELWRRSKIHLESHLKTAHPTAPVSLIFTAGQSAERTLHCLAQGLASAFSSALNASVLHIDGASKASQDSDEVKLDIDSQLKAAFEGDKPVAVIHRLEELPPGSTLIFYRYCDHENAAYKQVFLLFTVLLPQDEVSRDHCLKDVEEMVQDYVKERLVGSSSHTSFNEMDTDKYGGLWSRISHLILPVLSEERVEQKGC